MSKNPSDFREGDYVQRTKLEKDFPELVLSAITSTVQIQDKIKELVWCALKDKIVWIVIGGVITLALSFAQGYFSSLGSLVASPQSETTQEK